VHIETINTLYKQLHNHTKAIYGLPLWSRPPLTAEQKKERDAVFEKNKKNKSQSHGKKAKEWQP
jgi:hypothetical protein